MGRVTASEASQSPLTAIFEMRACTQVQALFFYILRWGDENPRPGFDNWRNHLDRTKKTIRMKLSHFTSLGFVKQK